MSRRVLVAVSVFWAVGGPGCFGATHQHLNAGAYGSEAGAALYFVNGDRFVASSGYVVGLEKAEVGTHAGLYRGGITLTSLAATLDFGGPTFDHAAMGAHLEAVLETLDGPPGGRIGFWESLDDEEGTALTFELSAGDRGGTNRIVLSQTDGSEGVDPYGHVHGRVFTATQPGLYTVGVRLKDTSANGPDGGPLHRDSDLFLLRFQAGVTLARIEVDGADVRIVFGTFSGYSYRLEGSTELGIGANWQPVGEVIRGDDRLRVITLPRAQVSGFFRVGRRAS